MMNSAKLKLSSGFRPINQSNVSSNMTNLTHHQRITPHNKYKLHQTTKTTA